MAKKKAKIPTLDLKILGKAPGLPALAPATGASIAEAAGVCLEHNGHKSGVTLKVAGQEEGTFKLRWKAATEQTHRTHNDLPRATENGACAIAILVTIELTGLTVIQQAVKGDGFDYWLGKDSETLFQNKARLEVSGILNGDDAEIRARVRKKVDQTKKSDAMKIAAYICVVEFSRPETRLLKR